MFSDLLNRDFIFFDGAQGTMLQKRGLKAGERPDIMNITAPEAVEDVQRQYVAAGSDLVYANSFGANALALKGTGYSPAEIISAAVAITKRACGDGAYAALDIGPIGELLEPFGSVTFEAAYELFREQAVAGQTAGADVAAIETMSDLRELKAAILAVRHNTQLPLFATMTFTKSGRTFTGCCPESFAIMAERLGASAIGINCSLAPVEMRDTAARIAEMTSLPLIVKPNAGLPNSAGEYDLGAAEFALQMAEYAAIGVKIVGGCCGSSPEYISELRRVFGTLTPGCAEKAAGQFICTPTRFERLDGLRIADDTPASPDDAIDAAACQAAGDDKIITINLPGGCTPEDAASIVVSVQEQTDKPVAIIGGTALVMDAALRAVNGIAAVRGIGDISEAARRYGAVEI